MNVLSNNTSNDLIRKKLLSDDVFFVGRMGLTELQIMYNYVNNIQSQNNLINLLINNAGVYGDCINEFLKIYYDSLTNSDLHVYWEIDSLKKMQNDLFINHLKTDTLIQNRSVEPFYFEHPWSSALINKKILVVHPFAETINTQYEKREYIFENKETLPSFNLITYKNIQSIGGVGPHDSWVESLRQMESEILELDFDIALLGCGAYGMPLGNFIKTNMKKSAIYVGGGLQILFGIKGLRWDSHETISKLYNNFWTRPKDSEKPKNHTSVENGCYW